MLSLHFEHRLAGKIHDGLAQIFTIICTQLEIANEELSSKEGETFSRIQRALELAHFGFAEARRFARNEPSNIVDESRLAEELRRLVERSTVPGRLRCDFRSDDLPAKRLSPTVQHALVRIAQEDSPQCCAPCESQRNRRKPALERTEYHSSDKRQ
jgi:signal transduction histidine kinase